MAVIALTASACATASNSLQSAISVHNSAKRIIETLDSAVAPAYKAAGAVADSTFPNDNAAFAKATEPIDAAVEFLTQAKQAEQLIQLGVAQWQSGVVGGEAMAREMAACGVEAIGGLGRAAALIPGAAAVLTAAAKSIGEDLMRIADGARCPEAKP
jgi:hypothetical protein